MACFADINVSQGCVATCKVGWDFYYAFYCKFTSKKFDCKFTKESSNEKFWPTLYFRVERQNFICYLLDSCWHLLRQQPSVVKRLFDEVH